MPQYNRAELGRIGTESGFVRDTFEKVLRLKEILKFLNEDKFLREHLLLKGGTAINLTVFNLPRLSVDIDMDYTPNDTREDMLECRAKITDIIKEYMESEGYQLSEASRFSHSLDAFHYNYQNTGGNRDMIKIELNYSLRAHIFEPVYRSILPETFDDSMKIRMVDPMEIFAAKGNALITRAAARDLYDWCNMLSEGLFEEQRDLFRKCFLFYMTISADITVTKLDSGTDKQGLAIGQFNAKTGSAMKCDVLHHLTPQLLTHLISTKSEEIYFQCLIRKIISSWMRERRLRRITYRISWC